MKLLLLQPPVEDFYHTEVRLQPLGLCYLKAAVRRHLPEVAVEVRDYHQGWGRRTVPLPPTLGHLVDFYPHPDRSPFSTFHRYYHFGASYEELAAEVAAARPDVVGIAANFSAYYREALRSAEAIRARTSVPIILGGAHVSADPEGVLASPAVDAAIRGEGERPLVEYLRTLVRGGDLAAVPNLAFRRGGRVVLNPLAPNYPLAELPAPDFNDLPLERYRLGRSPLATLIASRGCPHHCAFCAVRATFGAGHRQRAVTDVVAEIRSRYAAGYRVIDFEDDNLCQPPGFLKALCRALIQEFAGRGPELQAMNGVHYLGLDTGLLSLMRDAGFSHLNLSLVSRDEDLCRRLGRPSSTARFGEVVASARRLGLRTVAYQILGLPGETLESMIDTFVLLARLPLLLGVSPFYRAPGSAMAEASRPWTEAELVGCRLTAMGCGAEGVAREDVYTLFVTARIVNFLKGLQLPRPRVSLAQAMRVAQDGDARTRSGAPLLTRLLAEGVLYADTRAGPRALPKFRGPLFREVWGRVGAIATQAGGRIDLCAAGLATRPPVLPRGGGDDVVSDQR